MCRLAVYISSSVQTTGVHELTYTGSVYTDLWCTRLQGIHNLKLCTVWRQKFRGVQIQSPRKILITSTQTFICARVPGVPSLFSVHSSTQLTYQELSLNLHKVCGSHPVLSGRFTSPCVSVSSLPLSITAKKTVNHLTCTLSILLQNHERLFRENGGAIHTRQVIPKQS